MLFLARFVLKGQSQAALVAASMAILGLVLPPAVWLSAAAIVLVTLVNGPKYGLTSIAFSLFGAAIFAFLIFSAPELAIIFVLIAWLPAWILATVLRQSVSLAYTMQVLTVMSLLAVVMFYLLAPDIGEHWRESLDLLVKQLAQQSSELSLAELQQTKEWIIAFMPGLFVSSLMFGTMLSLLLGRWWQAVFYNPGGFGKEFRALNLGKVSALATIAILLAAVVLANVFSLAMISVMFVLYSIQALSLLHAAVEIRQLKGVWLFVVYVLLFFVPHLLFLLILACIADPWLDLRQRIARPAS